MSGERGVARLREKTERRMGAKKTEGGEGEGEGVKGRLVGGRKAARLRETMERRPEAKKNGVEKFHEIKQN